MSVFNCMWLDHLCMSTVHPHSQGTERHHHKGGHPLISSPTSLPTTSNLPSISIILRMFYNAENRLLASRDRGWRLSQMSEWGQKHKRLFVKSISPGNVMYSITSVYICVVYLKVAKWVDLESSHHTKKLCSYVCWWCWHFFFFLAALGLRCCVRAFSSSSERGLLFVAEHGL